MRRPRPGAAASLAAAVGVVALALGLATAGASRAQERRRVVGDFVVVIDKDPLTLAENVAASASVGGNLFGLRCLEGKVSFGLRAAGGAPLSAGDGVGAEIRAGGRTLRLSGAALNARDIEIPGAEAQLAALSGASRLEIALSTPANRETFALPVNGIDRAIAMVRLACGL